MNLTAVGDTLDTNQIIVPSDNIVFDALDDNIREQRAQQSVHRVYSRARLQSSILSAYGYTNLANRFFALLVVNHGVNDWIAKKNTPLGRAAKKCLQVFDEAMYSLVASLTVLHPKQFLTKSAMFLAHGLPETTLGKRLSPRVQQVFHHSLVCAATAMQVAALSTVSIALPLLLSIGAGITLHNAVFDDLATKNMIQHIEYINYGLCILPKLEYFVGILALEYIFSLAMPHWRGSTSS